MNTDTASIPEPNQDARKQELAHLQNSVPFPSRDGQFILALLRALRTMHDKGIYPTCKAVFAFIESEQFLVLSREDWEIYPSTFLNGGKEPRWQTVLRWSRDHCVELQYLENNETGVWWPTKPGLNCPVHAQTLFERQEWRVREAHWWSPRLKQLFDRKYSPCPSDAMRPQFVYEDFLPEGRRSVRGSAPKGKQVLSNYDAEIANVSKNWPVATPEKRASYIVSLHLDLDVGADADAVVRAIEAKYAPPVTLNLDDLLD